MHQAPSTKHCLCIAHRGAGGPENTMAAFRRALELGADGVECDVHLSKDGEAMVIHDDMLERTTNGRGRVVDFTSKELKKLNAGNGERIPTLDELLELAADRLMVFIEIKAPQAADRVAELVAQFGKHYGYARFPVIGFDWDVLVAVKKINADIVIGGTLPHDHTPPGAVKRALAAGMWSVNPCIDIMTREMVEEARAGGLKTIAWTANTNEQIARARSFGVDGIISDTMEKF